MNQTLITLVEDMLRMRCVYTSGSVLRNNHFFQDERLAEGVELKMNFSYFNGRQKGLYGVVREFDEKKPVVDLFFLHECFPSEVYQDAICEMNINYIVGGDMRVPLEDPLTAEEVTRSLFDGTYQPLYDTRPLLNASWIRVKPFYAIGVEENVEEKALTESMRQVRIFLEMYSPLKRLFTDVDFSVHDPALFSKFLVGAEFSFADNVEGADVMVQRAKEVYGMFKSQ
ncbi:MAG: hypothetical protein A2912_01285 [Candidatus Buchananbacteria bacterium RIFCSPLOWO2_01_FULL_40_23b]|uniref:Uncharacterized protein n=1 Tax=Candidatus Buchananbacteria bacterium RIFCSPLOWO2_01_FULL_40_23b TaxID=1797544 RepID=A0A1G1YVD2_9BACT|nr:MAG: hypothetical protein A2912_01285 [Candidatus Buchananbacteria bacterium RIFCSPLOWO2_01_FULL_40_23b]